MVFGFLVFSVSFISCGVKSTDIDDFYFEIDLRESYNFDEDIHLSISLGLNPNYKSKFLNSKNKKVVFSYSKIDFDHASNENITVLYAITDFYNQEYYLTKKGKKIKANFSKDFVIAKEYFSNDYGEIFFMMYETSTDFSSDHSPIMSQKYIYRIKENKLFFYS